MTAGVDSTRALPEAPGPPPPVEDEVTALRRENRQLGEALASRATIDQAKGMVMAELRCGAEEAFAVLREISSHTNVKVRDVAAAMTYRAGAGDDPFTGCRQHLRRITTDGAVGVPDPVVMAPPTPRTTPPTAGPGRSSRPGVDCRARGCARGLTAPRE